MNEVEKTNYVAGYRKGIKKYTQNVRLPGLSYDVVFSVTPTETLIVYTGITYDHYDTIVSIYKDLEDYGIGPKVYDCGRVGNKSWIKYERVYDIPEFLLYTFNKTYNHKINIPQNVLDKITRLIKTLHDIGIGHGYIEESLKQTETGNYVLSTVDSGFYIGHGNLDRLNSYAPIIGNVTKLKSRSKLESLFLFLDDTVVESLA